MVEYGVKGTTPIREAHLLLGSPPRFWFAGNSRANAIVSMGLANDDERTFELPLASPATEEPFTLQRGAGGTLWVASKVTGVVAHFDPQGEEWLNVLEVKSGEGAPVNINCLNIGYKGEVMEDGRGRIWFSGSGSAVLGYFEPETGNTSLFPVPAIPGRPAVPGAGIGCLVMSPDRNFVWYSQTEIGVLGAIDTRTHEFQTVVLQDPNAGPQRFTLSDEGVLYAPLFGTGQLLVHDTAANEQTIHDLPDRASAPYAATFDPVRRVVWVTGSNSDVIYRFDPGAGAFTVQPLPRRAAYLRRIAVEPVTGLLVGAYANSGDRIGSRDMILTVDPGDNVYRARTRPGPAGAAYVE
jgi:streptogramin lyase